MGWDNEDNKYNRFNNLDGIEDKIIFYLISEQGKDADQLKLTHTIWRILYYNDDYALIEDEAHPLPKYKDIVKLVDNNGVDQSGKRLFRYPFVEDSFIERCSQIRVFVDSITPDTHLFATVNIGVETIIHNKLSNLINDLYNEEEELNNPTEGYPLVMYKNRGTVLLKCVLALLNGADIAGVGQLQFNQNKSPFSVSRMGLWNNRNYYGYKNILSCGMGGVA